MQSFNFRSAVLPELSFDEESVIYNQPDTVSQPPTQLVQFDTEEPQLR